MSGSLLAGHLGEHDAPESDCGPVSDDPIKRVTLVAQATVWEVAPGESFLPTPGVTYYFMVSTPARFGSIMTIAERTNLVPIVWN